jgi:hypothetical protein
MKPLTLGDLRLVVIFYTEANVPIPGNVDGSPMTTARALWESVHRLLPAVHGHPVWPAVRVWSQDRFGRKPDRHVLTDLADRIAVWRGVSPDLALDTPLDDVVAFLALHRAAPKKTDAEWYIDLAGMAILVKLTTRGLEHYKNKKDPIPDPDRPGGGGKKDEWKWLTVRPWLERTFNRDLSWVNPENRPGAGIR